MHEAHAGAAVRREDDEVSEKWRRCARCRSIKPVDDFDADEQTCRVCLAAPVRKATTRAAGTVTTRRVSVEAADEGPAGTVVRSIAPRDVRGRGDHEVRARRARVRALDRLAEEYPDDFARLLADERRSEGLT